MHWKKFVEAHNNITAWTRVMLEQGIPVPSMSLSALLAKGLLHAERFYVPEDVNLITGKSITPELKETLRLPYPVTAILSEASLESGPRSNRKLEGRGWRISVCVSKIPDGLSEVVWDESPGRGFLVLSAMKFPSDGPHWTCDGCGVIVWMPDEGLGYTIQPLIPDGLRERLAAVGGSQDDIVENYKGDVGEVMNLMVMLSLKNVKAGRVAVPKKMAKARRRRKRQPLYDYKVLVVDGERWDRHVGATSTGAGYRSHLRRGHIRRLWDGRHVWVRQAIVHGKRPGFVDKEYKMGTGEMPPEKRS